jgi:hypothetical protein
MTPLDLIEVFNTEFLHNVLTAMIYKVEPPLLLHVGAVDSWPVVQQRESAAMIFNTDYTGEAGEHWVAVFIDGPKEKAFVFDSLPVRPFPLEILHKLKGMDVSVSDANPMHHIFQHPEFPLCGLYCLAFLDHCSKNKTFQLCINDQLSNDLSVVSHVMPFICASFKQ